MPKYLFLDNQGVLDGSLTFETPSENDLILETIGSHTYQVWKDGVLCVNLLNELVNQFDYQLLFQTKNSLTEQLHLIKKLQLASIQKKLTFPVIHATAICNPHLYPEVESTKPIISQHENMLVAIFGVGLQCKICIRQALSSMLHILPEEKHLHTVIDDCKNVIDEAKAEGFQTYYISTTEEGNTLVNVLSELILVNQKLTVAT